MIFETLSFLSSEVNKFLNLKLGSVTDARLKIGNISRALDESFSGPNSLGGKAILSLVNIEEDRIFRKQENFRKTATGTIYQSPPLYLNLYILFAVNKSEYDDTLKWLAAIIQFFQHQHVFTQSSHPSLNPQIHKLVVELHSLNFEQINHLWGTLGGKYLPSVLYKVRQITLDEGLTTGETPLISEIDIHHSVKHPES